MAKVNLKGSITAKCEVSGNITIIYNFAHQHMQSAIKLGELAGQLEHDNSRAKDGAFFQNIKTYVSSAIILSVCALEANINEHLGSTNGILKDYEDDHRALISPEDKWRGIIEKYQLGLLLNKKPLLKFDKEPYQSLQYLIRFRNLLVHYKPESEPGFRSSKKLEKSLCSKIEESAFTSRRDPFLTQRAMSYSCAKWAVNTALNFSKEYCKILNIEDKFSNLKCL